MAAVPDMADVKVCLSLDDPAARDVTACGAKAAGLAIARSAGLPVIPGVVITTAAHEHYLRAGRTVPPEMAVALRPGWESVSTGGSVSLVVRSSSTIEDVAASSMAGQFRSVLNAGLG
jgi:pyruvate,water dikinase